MKDDNDVEIIYNTRLRDGRISEDFRKRITKALLFDIQIKNSDVKCEEEDANVSVNDDADYIPKEEVTSDIESEIEIEPNHIFDSDEEEDCNDESSEEPPSSDTCFIGKDGTIWEKNEYNALFRTRVHNIMRIKPGHKQQNTIPIEVFKKFFSPNISYIIITETNRYGRAAYAKWNEKNPHMKPKVWTNVSSTELDAFIAILLAAGVTRNNMHSASLLWQTDALPIFRAAISLKRFTLLLRYIRFDDGRTRQLRKKSDKAAAIRDVWNLLNENLANYYEPHEIITIDEQLFPYRGKTRFTQYIPSNPSKYGIKVWWACDAQTKFPLQGLLYTGKDDEVAREGNQGENVLLTLSKRYENTGRTIVANNFFTTLEGVKRLRNIGLSFTGPIRSNERCLPAEMKDSFRPMLSTVFGFHEDTVSICSYIPKKNKVVNLLSTLHYTTNCVGEAKKPEALVFYNKNKAVVETMDQMVTQYTTKRPTTRWSFAFFCNMLDVMGLAAFVICKELDHFNKKVARRTFLENLAKTLATPNIENRMNNPHIFSQFSCRLAFESFFGVTLNDPQQRSVATISSGPETLRGKRDCRRCLQSNDKLRRKTRFFCKKCTNPVCQQHSKINYICFNCITQQ